MIHSKNYPLLFFPEIAGKTRQWYCGDSKEYYDKHNKPKWKYYNTEDKLFYKFNKLGYRTTELDALPEKFVLVFGCSYTEGVGMFEETLWCNILAEKYNFNVINLAKAGTGPDIINFNTQLWVKNNFIKPQAVIVQWPQATRKSFSYIKRNGLFGTTHLQLEDRNVMIDDQLYNPDDSYQSKDTEWYFKRWISEEGQLHYENLLHINSVTNVWKSLGVPILNWTWQGDFELKYNKDMLHMVKTTGGSRARDGDHDGEEIHQQVVQQIEDKVKCMI